MKRKQTTNSGKVEGIIHESSDGGQPLQLFVLWRNSEDKSPSKENHEAWRLVKLCSTPSTLTNCQFGSFDNALTSLYEGTRMDFDNCSLIEKAQT